jgi:hypothetical protein
VVLIYAGAPKVDTTSVVVDTLAARALYDNNLFVRPGVMVEDNIERASNNDLRYVGPPGFEYSVLIRALDPQTKEPLAREAVFNQQAHARLYPARDLKGVGKRVWELAGSLQTANGQQIPAVLEVTVFYAE